MMREVPLALLTGYLRSETNLQCDPLFAQAADEIDRLRVDLVTWQDAVFHFDAECDQRLDAKNRYRTAWVSAFASRRRWIKRATEAEAAIARVREFLSHTHGGSAERVDGLVFITRGVLRAIEEEQT